MADKSQQVQNLVQTVDRRTQKLVMMTSLGCGGTSPTVKFSLSAMFGFGAIGDMDKADTLIRDNFDNFVIARPPRIDEAALPAGDGKDGGVLEERYPPYQATTDFPRFCPIACGMTQAAVARFLVDCAENSRWDGNAVQIYAA